MPTSRKRLRETKAFCAFDSLHESLLENLLRFIRREFEQIHAGTAGRQTKCLGDSMDSEGRLKIPEPEKGRSGTRRDEHEKCRPLLVGHFFLREKRVSGKRANKGEKANQDTSFIAKSVEKVPATKCSSASETPADYSEGGGERSYAFDVF